MLNHHHAGPDQLRKFFFSVLFTKAKMITTKWGPPGWVFMHEITFGYPDHPTSAQAAGYSKFFNVLQQVLPCKYCRESFKQFLTELPLKGHDGSRYQLTHWFYQMHNKVNNKLRKQEAEAFEKKLIEIQEHVTNEELCFADAMKELEKFAKTSMITDSDPTYASVARRYDSSISPADKGDMWLFIGAIVFNYPEKINARDADHVQKRKATAEFFAILPEVIPYAGYGEKMFRWMEEHEIQLQSRDALVSWFHALFLATANFSGMRTNVKNMKSRSKMCELLETFRAGQCGRQSVKKTCRASEPPKKTTK